MITWCSYTDWRTLDSVGDDYLWSIYLLCLSITPCRSNMDTFQWSISMKHFNEAFHWHLDESLMTYPEFIAEDHTGRQAGRGGMEGRRDGFTHTWECERESVVWKTRYLPMQPISQMQRCGVSIDWRLGVVVRHIVVSVHFTVPQKALIVLIP